MSLTFGRDDRQVEITKKYKLLTEPFPYRYTTTFSFKYSLHRF